MDLVQIILAGAIFVLTVVLSLVGVEVFLIFKEVRESVRKGNKVLDDVGIVSELVTRQVTTITGLFETMTTAAGLIRRFLGKGEEKGGPTGKRLSSENETGDDSSSSATPTTDSPGAPTPAVRHFFTKGGRRLS